MSRVPFTTDGPYRKACLLDRIPTVALAFGVVLTFLAGFVACIY